MQGNAEIESFKNIFCSSLNRIDETCEKLFNEGLICRKGRDEVIKEAKRLANGYAENDFSPKYKRITQKSINEILMSCIYLASVSEYSILTQEEVGKAGNTTPYLIRKWYPMIVESLDLFDQYPYKDYLIKEQNI